MKGDKLTPKQERFVQGLFAGLSQREAYKQAYNAGGMTDKQCDEEACKLAASPKISQRLAELVAKLQERNMVTKERVMQEYAKLAFFDPRKLFRADGTPKDITELDDETAAALAGLDAKEIIAGEDDADLCRILKYKLVDKKGALDSIAKILGMFEDKIKIDGSVPVKIIDDIE